MKNLIIPIEIKHREILGAISLSYSALNNGWTVFLGQKSQIFPFIPFFYKSIWFLKSIVPGEISNLIKIKKYGHKLTTLDVEGLILSNGDFGPIKRYSEQTIELAEAIFYWGAESHYEPVKKVFPNIKNKSFVTGSPIVDTWFLEKNNFYSKKKLIKKTNKSILISVNFARADPKLKKARKFYEKFYSGFQNFRGNDIVNYNKESNLPQQVTIP